MNRLFTRNFKKLLSDIEVEYNRQAGMVEMLQERLNQFRRDEEIQKLETEIQELRKLSLLILSPVERDRVDAFRTHHWKKCDNPNAFRYEIHGTGIGACISITCPRCGETEDVTDIDSW